MSNTIVDNLVLNREKIDHLPINELIEHHDLLMTACLVQFAADMLEIQPELGEVFKKKYGTLAHNLIYKVKES